MRSAISAATALGLIALAAIPFSSSAHAYPRLWPPELRFGEVRIGAVVEGTVEFVLDSAERSGTRIEAIPPEGMSVDQVRVATSKIVGPAGESATTRIEVAFSVDTSQLAEFAGALKIWFGSQVREIPFAIRVVEKNPEAIRVLVVDSLYSQGTGEAKTVQKWCDLIEAGEFDVDYVDARPGRAAFAGRTLESYDAILLGMTLSSPAWSTADVEALYRYVEQGGRAILFLSGQMPAVPMQPLLQRVGIELGKEYVFEIGKPGASSGESQIADSPYAEGIERVGWGNPTSATIVDPDQASLLVFHPFDDQKGMVAIGNVGKGEVIVVTEPQPWFWLGRGPNVDNPALMRNFLTVGLPREKQAEAPAAPEGDIAP